ncbi:MAG: long-chain fatty acid--CoA ligase [Rhizobacter sp.]|nr:long-chain fatty acid--CoA ligase [Chlorobiales bacterium]
MPAPVPMRVFDLISHQLAHHPKPDALASKVDGLWKKISTQEFYDTVNHIALGLAGIGIKKGDTIANINETSRPEWNFIDAAAMSVGAVHVPVYPTLTAEDYKFIFNDAGVKLIFVSSDALYKVICTIAADIPTLQGIYTYDKITGVKQWTELREAGKSQSIAELESLKANVAPNDLATLIYTSGTTGTPKGVMLSHRNLLSNALTCTKYMKATAEETALSFLPLCHIFERLMINMYIYEGCSIYYAQNLTTIADDLKDVKPNIFATVPRVLEKIYDKIVARGNGLTGVKRMLFKWAMELGHRYDPQINHGAIYNVQLALAGKLVFSKWREAFGGNVRALVSGGAALQPRLARIFLAAQINVCEGYGLTESSPVIAVNRPDGGRNRVGTVGEVVEDGEVKIADDGEILYRGPNVMLGYYRRPDLTAEVLDKDGWLHTGDIGEYTDGYLKITDRKKEIFKTSGGKYVAPQVIENKMKESRYIEQVLIIGEHKNFPAALIVPSFTNIKAKFDHEGILLEGTDAEIIGHPAVLALIDREVARYNENFAHYMQVKKFTLLPNEWTTAKGELSAKLSYRRKVIHKNYEAQIEAMYKTEPATEKAVS